jgi:hypothetical protein
MNDQERVQDQRAVLPRLPTIDDRGFGLIDGRSYVELSENGWGGVITEVAEPHRLRRVPIEITDFTTTVTYEREGRKWSESMPRTAAEQQSIDDDIDEYLSAAGLPPRVRGFRWFIEVPPGVPNEDEFWRRIVGRFGELTSNAPDNVETREALTAIVRELWSDAADG